MSLVIEVWTLVVRRDALASRFPGGIEEFERRVPTSTFHADEYLAGASFMLYDDLKVFGLELLNDSELVGWEDDTWHDMVPVDQVDGPRPNDWLEIGQHPEVYTFAWLKGTEPGELAAAADWTPERSRSWITLHPSELRERYEPVTLWYETPAEAFAAAGRQAIRDKETGELLYTSGSGNPALPPEGK